MAFCREQKFFFCVNRSDYRKSLPGDFIRIRLKIEQNYRLYLDIFFSAIINDLFITFISRLKVDAKCVYQQWNWITVANYFGTPPADWVHGYLYFEPGAWMWTKGFRRYLHIVKNWSGNFSLNSSRVRALGWPLLGNFSGFFWIFLGGSVGQIIYREYIVFRGSNISCSLAFSERYMGGNCCLCEADEGAQRHALSSKVWTKSILSVVILINISDWSHWSYLTKREM